MSTRSLAVTVALFFVSPALAQTADLTEGAACTPTIIGQALRAQFFDVVVEGNVAYVAAGHPGLLTLDITDLKSPKPLGEIDAGSDLACALDVHNGVAYVATSASGLKIFDVTNPAEPALLSAVDIAGSTRDVVVVDGIAYVANGANAYGSSTCRIRRIP